MGQGLREEDGRCAYCTDALNDGTAQLADGSERGRRSWMDVGFG